MVLPTSHSTSQLVLNGAGDAASTCIPNPTGPTTVRCFPILALPREIRDTIYAHLIPPNLAFTMPNQPKQKLHPRRHNGTKCTFGQLYLAKTPILFTNRQLRTEVLDALYTHTTFSFHWRRRSKNILKLLREALPAAAKARIRHLAWKEMGLHTGGEPKGFKGWANVMAYISEHFACLRTVYFEFSAGTGGYGDARGWGGNYQSWEVPRLAAQMLADGRIERLEYGWKRDWFSKGEAGTDEGVARIATTLLSIPYDVAKDSEMGWEFRRLLLGREKLLNGGGYRDLGGGKREDEWALECLARPRHRFDVVWKPGEPSRFSKAQLMVFTRKS